MEHIIHAQFDNREVYLQLRRRERAYVSERKRKGKLLCRTPQPKRCVLSLFLQNMSGRDQERNEPTRSKKRGDVLVVKDKKATFPK